MNERHFLSIELTEGLYTSKIAMLLTLIPIMSMFLLHTGSLISKKDIGFLTQKQIPVPPPFFHYFNLFLSLKSLLKKKLFLCLKRSPANTKYLVN